ncbi:hypothetical protein KI387_041671 [Taxus chinensis]|uniref:Uncharacterized protein n=1 Tax=Taxus chinensis TaxID=29808 RepID=A0AA38F8Q9_TAXCH|nr:hypothetical protein KI387_041671 [Taxus chinensis]
MLGNNIPEVCDVVNMVKRYKIRKVRLFEAHHEALKSLANSGIEVIVGVGNNELGIIASDWAGANCYVDNKTDISLDYALLNPSVTILNEEGGRKYRSLFYAMLDSLITACG